MLRELRWVWFVPVFFMLPACERAKQGQARAEAVEEIDSIRKDFANQLEMTDEGLKVDFEAVDEHNRKVEKTAEKLGGKLGEAMKVVTSMQGEVNEVARECSEMSEEFEAMLDWQTLDENRDYQARRDWLARYVGVNQKTLDAYEAYPKNVAKKLDEIGFSGKERTEFDEGFQRMLRRTGKLIRTIRQCDIDNGRILIAVMDRLEQLGESWEWISDDEGIQFKEDKDLEWFQGEMDKLVQQGEAQMEAQEKLAEMLKQN